MKAPFVEFDESMTKYGIVCSEFLRSGHTRSELFVYIALASFQGLEKKFCTPSFSQIAIRSGLKTSLEVALSISRLASQGWVECLQSRKKPTTYKVIRKSSVYAAIPTALLKAGLLSKNAILCYGALTTFPGYSSLLDLGKRAGIQNLSSVYKGIKILESLGYIRRPQSQVKQHKHGY